MLNKEQIIHARNLSIEDMMEMGFTLEELLDEGEIIEAYYAPSDSHEFFDGDNFYNKSGQLLRDPDEYDQHSEGYTPFGDE